jgi:hypothetical protein
MHCSVDKIQRCCLVLNYGSVVFSLVSVQFKQSYTHHKILYTDCKGVSAHLTIYSGQNVLKSTLFATKHAVKYLPGSINSLKTTAEELNHVIDFR